MGLRFRQSFTLFPGVRLNLGKQGISASFGAPGATLNLSGRGLRGTVGIPGSGLSYSAALTPNAGVVPPAEANYWQPPLRPDDRPSPSSEQTPSAYMRVPGMREIGSAAVESLTSAGLIEFRAMIVDAERQRKEIDQDLSEAQREHSARKAELTRKKNSLLWFLFKKRIAKLEEDVPKLSAEVERLEAWRDATHIEVHFDADDAAQRAYAAVVRAYDALRSCTFIWDVTSDRDTNRVAERTSAARLVERRKVNLDYSKSDLIRFGGQAMRFANANGEDIQLYPGVILMQRADGAFALLDLREVSVECHNVNFIEDEQVPSDAEVISRTWAKVNKDGSPDRRFRDNYQIPVCVYGRVKLTSPSGLCEEYQFSNARSAAAFGQAFGDYQAALRMLADA